MEKNEFVVHDDRLTVPAADFHAPEFRRSRFLPGEVQPRFTDDAVVTAVERRPIDGSSGLLIDSQG